MSVRLGWGHLKRKWIRDIGMNAHTHKKKNIWDMCEFNSKVPLWFLLLKLWRLAPLKKTWIIGTGCGVQPPITQATGNENSIVKDPSSLLLCQYWSPLAVSGDMQRCQGGEPRKLSRAAHSTSEPWLFISWIISIFSSSQAVLPCSLMLVCLSVLLTICVPTVH